MQLAGDEEQTTGNIGLVASRVIDSWASFALH
jgi:hypothetical protein